MVEINTSQLLFLLSEDNVDISKNTTVNLRARAMSINGEEAIRDLGSVTILARYTNNNRYGQRDEDMGGDDWALPSTLELAREYTDCLWGDFSNMNGGPFPPHQSHRDGTDIDGWFYGYNARDDNTARTIINFLNNSNYGSKITAVYVTFNRSEDDSFWTTIREVELIDGRNARDVIIPLSGHETHFHFRLNNF